VEEVAVTIEDSEDSPIVQEPADMFVGAQGEPLSSHHLQAITYFRRKQSKGFIDVWWLYDDGGMNSTKV
jgi:hypothetical protein